MESNVVTEQAQLDALCGRWAHSDWLGVDTEFLRVRTYFPKLCLIQVATADEAQCIDPLSKGLDLAPLCELFTSRQITKVLHSARQDLEVLYPILGDVVSPVFDTQIAAALLGHGPQVGYAALVENLLGHELPKSQTRTDWCARPLREAQIRYAIDDVCYLGGLYAALRAGLEERRRLPWAEEEFSALGDADLYRLDAAQAYTRLPRGCVLSKPKQHLLKELAAWRERTAQQRDLPRNWVAADKLLFQLAESSPATLAELGSVPGVDAKFAGRHGKALLSRIAEVGKRDGQDWIWHQPRKLTTGERRFCDQLAKFVQDRGEQQQVAPSLIATRRDLERLVRGDRDIPLLRGWRQQLVGGELERLADDWRQASGASNSVSS